MLFAKNLFLGQWKSLCLETNSHLGTQKQHGGSNLTQG